MDEMQFNSSWITAHACLRNSPDNCAVLVFQALPDARLYVRNPTKRFVRFDLRDDVQRWMVVFEQSFSVTRCYTVATLQEEMAKFGYTPPPPP